MTNNIIGFLNAQETHRHNVEMEKYQQAGLSESQRHNVVSEGYTGRSIAETVRHNQASELLGYANVGLGYSELAEKRRHDVVTENLSGLETGARVANLGAQTESELARAGLLKAQTITEGFRPAQVKAETFGTYARAASDIASTASKAVDVVKGIVSLVPSITQSKLDKERASFVKDFGFSPF